MDVLRIWVDEDDRIDPAGAPTDVSGDPEPGGWFMMGTTCLPDMIPGVKPYPTVNMIVNAFHKTPWAKGAISTQPKGDTTLVNLKTFYKVDWAASGFEPGEVDLVDPATMFGYRVEIRPKLVSYVYRFGDGTSEGPTTSPGGVYPDGDIVHTYRRPGTYTSRVEVTFGADFRINGGAWIAIPDTVTVPQPGTPITVKEARGVLVRD